LLSCDGNEGLFQLVNVFDSHARFPLYLRFRVQVGRSNAKAAEAARKTQMNFMNPATEVEGADAMVMRSMAVRFLPHRRSFFLCLTARAQSNLSSSSSSS
jgi:hypothetical protein